MVGAESDAAESGSGNLWEELLRRVSNGARDVQSSTVVMVGAPGAGKRTLCNKLLQAEVRARLRRADVSAQQVENEVDEAVRARGVSMAAVGYTYLNPPVDPEPPIKVDLWVLEDAKKGAHGLATAIPDASALRNTVAVLVVDLSRPWDAMKSLEDWYTALHTHVDGLNKATAESETKTDGESEADSMNVRDVLRKRMARYLSAVKLAAGDQSKFDALFNADASDNVEAKSNEADLPVTPDHLPPKALGIPMLVVGTKADVIREASDDVETELRLEFIQRTLRQFCLDAGASLTYVSSRADTSSLSLLQYLVHVVCPQAPQLATKADEQPQGGVLAPLSLISKRDVVHVPAGADHAELIGALANSKQSGIVDWTVSDRFEDVIRAPAATSDSNEGSAPDGQEEEDVALAHASFLAKLLARQKLLPEMGRPVKTDAAASALEAFNETATSMKPGIVSTATPVKRSPAEGSTSDSVSTSASADPGSARRVTAQDAKENPALIANFFQNLLNRDKEK
ncbi:Cytoplasmic dynein 1 light intermediate chain 1 [Hondaea fermentalgiana]|uniref:Dynein light intermediate chain n=1 Tax=Hondaea fermentalgiana TaxID=2315210 RepID=A0A2R5G4L5_9STRA|nr:Cytoplasmic dynein 1 light intermediate chain 1 [Hondaea fermentalgiana]|eukprot:GBG25930.1 Cytoplasmic dynein 1 light intermediate chain 1 [Hondaea fermentalgiana]